MNMNRQALVLLAALFVAGGTRAGVLQTLGGVTPWGVDGHNVVGYIGNNRSFLYDDVTEIRTTLPFLGGAQGISGDIIVGGHGILGFSYKLSTGEFTTMMHPLAARTHPEDIDGDNVVGNYVDAAGKQHGFLYNLATQTWTTLDYPAASLGEMTVNGISGNYLVGYYKAGTNPHFSFLYDLTTSSWLTFGINAMKANGIDGENIVGGWNGGGGPGWIYNITTSEITYPFTEISLPPGQILQGQTITDISGNTIVGIYNYWNGQFSATSGFVFIGVPELGTFALTAITAAGLGLLSLRRIRRRARP